MRNNAITEPDEPKTRAELRRELARVRWGLSAACQEMRNGNFEAAQLLAETTNAGRSVMTLADVDAAGQRLVDTARRRRRWLVYYFGPRERA